MWARVELDVYFHVLTVQPPVCTPNDGMFTLMQRKESVFVHPFYLVLRLHQCKLSCELWYSNRGWCGPCFPLFVPPPSTYLFLFVLSLNLCNRIFTAIMPMVAAGLIPDDPTLQPIRRLVSLVWFSIWSLCQLTASITLHVLGLHFYPFPLFWLADCGAVLLSLTTGMIAILKISQSEYKHVLSSVSTPNRPQ